MDNPTPSGYGTDNQIHFACTTCGKSLRVASEASGKSAKCPECGAVQAVPLANQAPLTNQSPLANQAPPDPQTSAPSVDGYYATRPAPTTVSPTEAFASQPAAVQPAASQPAASPPAPAEPLTPPGFDRKPVEVSNRPTPTLSLATSKEYQSGSNTPTKKLFDRLIGEIRKIYVGQEELVLGTLVALFSSGHVLIESVPGLGKTLFVRTMGRVMGCSFGRIQFTADLMPSDITGAPIFNMKTQEFTFRPGPVFTQLLLADEINRSPAKTHAALLEIMQEYRVTVDGKAHSLERPFLVLATQNPIESEGTYNLPEAQLDRFMFKLVADYPAAEEEARILREHSQQRDVNKLLEEEISTITSPAEIMEVIQSGATVRIDDKLVDYINQIVRLTRQWPQLHMGASPRAGISLMQGARTLAAFHGRDFAVPDDVAQIALPALRHRVTLTAEAEVEGHSVDELLTNLIRQVEVPRL